MTYTNTADAPVTLDLAINAPHAPAGRCSRCPPRRSPCPRTAPARSPSPPTWTRLPLDSHLSGMIDASDADGTVLAHTLIGVGKEGERYNLSITAKDRGGEPLVRAASFVAGKKRLRRRATCDESGTGTLRMPAGTYVGVARGRRAGHSRPALPGHGHADRSRDHPGPGSRRSPWTPRKARAGHGRHAPGDHASPRSAGHLPGLRHRRLRWPSSRLPRRRVRQRVGAAHRQEGHRGRVRLRRPLAQGASRP